MLSEEKSMVRERPFVSTILVTFNESQYIERSLGSLLNQDYPKDCYEIIIIDGESTDDTLLKAESLVKNYSANKVLLPQINYYNNPKKILATGWNIGIVNAKGEYVIRIDAHAEVREDFIRLNVETINLVDAVCVGGKLITKSDGEMGEIVRDVMSSPFGVGNSSFRTSNVEGYSDTAVYGLYKRDIFQKAGYFNEKLVRNQDIEMHSRIKQCGGKFYFNPHIQSIYYSRDSIKKMIKQAYGNGMWNLIIFKFNKAKLSVRHLVPFFFLMFIFVTSMLGLFCHWILWFEAMVFGVYFVLGTITAIIKTKKIRNIIVMPGIFFLLHISYGFGSLMGVFKKN